jgi:hypothetical protein
MRFVWSLAVCLALYSCAAQKASSPQQDCTREMGAARGAKDGKSGKVPDLSFLQACVEESRALSLSSYRDAFETAKAKRLKEEIEKESAAAPTAVTFTPAGRQPAAQNWVCEVEANSKIFTGTGISKDEALGSAKSTCVSHFQPSNCTSVECKQNL